MVRSLPKRHNPLILPDASPDYEELLARRRLGKTHLAVKPAQIGTSNATKPENLGPFEYAHLRAPLPKDLKGSEIFPSHNPQQHPETYFLMRRSKDGYISATGMFKIAFPWAKLEEEKAEREYLKTREETSEDEIAGNVWISPILALELAKEYRMYDWVRALLDSRDIVQSPSSAKKQITPPPKFEMPPLETTTQLQPPAASRTRSRRSASPSKKVASPRKPRQTRATKEASAAASSAASATLQSALDTAASTADSESVDGTAELNGEVNGEERAAEESEKKAETRSKSKKAAATAADEKVKVDVEKSVDAGKDVEATQTTVSVEMPVSLPEAPPAEDTEQMIAKAKEMVEEASKLQQAEAETAEASSSPNAAKKRKSDDLVEGEEQTADTPAQPTKRARVLEDKLKRERVRNRALVGVTATLALAAAIPYFF
ncbi:hypothetical protein VTN00DRAFT_9871 [Thermoascus crustaceus]|uniref:uncharacterized protein n=1 Tax=Thermoascus crustaceus TaxID=5088 RepID=UPI00374292B6